MKLRFKRILRWCRNAVLALFVFSLFMVLVYKWLPVPFTPLMFIRALDPETPQMKHHWVSIDKISHAMPLAVVASEDNRFMTHHGFDHEQIRQAMEEAKRGGRKRGASTISQQTAKNVFLWPGRSWIRKGLEAYFTVLIEFVWGKERIMEVYLNSIEMGRGIFGVEAASRTYFSKSAASLTRSEAALIAAALPNPRKRNPGAPSAYMRKRQGAILSLMNKVGAVPIGSGSPAAVDAAPAEKPQPAAPSSRPKPTPAKTAKPRRLCFIVQYCIRQCFRCCCGERNCFFIVVKTLIERTFPIVACSIARTHKKDIKYAGSNPLQRLHIIPF